MSLQFWFGNPLGWTVLGGILLAASPSVAAERAGSLPCTKAPSDQEVQEAKQAFEEGQSAYQEGAYTRAIALWSSAYEKDCTAHALLLNLATAHELLHQPHQAIHALRLFNRRLPQSPYVASNFKRIIRLEDRLQKEIAQAKEQEALRKQESELARPVPAPTKIQDTSGPHWLPVGVFGGGLVTALAGIGIYAEAHSAEKAASVQCGETRARCEDLEAVLLGERARSRSDIGVALSAGGLTVAAAGLVWLWLTDEESPELAQETRVRVGAAVSADSLGLNLSGRF